jgi:PAS domain S-box-containing protein
MIKTLKGKIAIIYVLLILMIAIVGLTSVLSFLKLSKSVDSLMIDNYKSINAARNMMDAMDEQNIAILNYLNNRGKNEISIFYESSDKFYKWFNIETNNVTESGEQENVDRINNYYLEYSKSFSQIQDLKEKVGVEGAREFYDSKVEPLHNGLQNELNDLWKLNEEAMFTSKNKVTKDTVTIMYTVLALSTIAVVGGYLVSRFFANKFLRPIYVLTEAVKRVQEGDLEQQAYVQSNDEIGSLAHEFNNMTKRIKQFEKSSKGKLLAEKNKSIAIVKSISDPLIVLDMNFKVTLVNKACEEVFDIEEKSVLHKHFFEAFRYANLYDFIASAYTECDKRHSEEIIKITSKEKEYYFNVIISIVKDSELKVNEIVVLLQNVTELKQLEKMKTDFIATISHEFKTPLTSIMMGVSLIEDDNIGQLNEKQISIVDTIKDDADTLSDLVSDLIHLSKIESEKAIYSMESCSIIGIIENSISNFYSQAEGKEVVLHYEASEELSKVFGDMEKLTWVLNNLISNSLKHTNAGDEIFIKACVREDKICVSVEDSGEGIPSQYQKNIFDKYVQVEQGQGDIKGSGLGLAIAREIVEAHGGNIWCESKLDEGSTFIFTLQIEQ